jgi:hypothetical protein
VPVATALDNAMAGRESILRYDNVQDGNLKGLVKISDIDGKWRERLKKQTARKQLRAVVTQGRLK